MEVALNSYFVERKEEIHGLVLALLSGTNVLLLGPPGTAKSLLINTWSSLIKGASCFNWLLTRFSTPEELFGPYSLKGLEEDSFRRITTGKLPEANIAFLDEIFKCNPGVLNSLLSVLNERTFYNDGKAVDLDLISVIGASNEIPEEDDNLEALYDRFQLKYKVSPIRESSNFIKMLNNSEQFNTKFLISFEEIKQIRDEVKKISFSENSEQTIADLKRILNKKNIIITDRTFKFAKKILQAEAYTKNRSEIVEEDFEILQHVLWSNPDDKKLVYSEILSLINPEKNDILDIYNDAFDLAKTSLAIKGKKERTETGLETATKLKDAKKKLHALSLKMEKKGRDLSDVKKYETKLEKMLQRVFNEMCGVDFS
jgi:MoxR-like ATPase